MAKWTRIVGSVLGALFMLSVLARGLFDAYGYVGAFLGFFSPSVGKFITSPNGTVFLVLCGIFFIWWAVRHPKEPVDVKSLHEANTRHENDIASLAKGHQETAVLKQRIAELEAAKQGRHLSETQMSTIARVAGDGLRNLYSSLRESGSFSPEDLERKLAVKIIAFGESAEVKSYRKDFESAFTAAGFEVFLAEVMTFGQDEAFGGVVSVIRSGPKNVVRPFVLTALRDAQLNPRDADELLGNLSFSRNSPPPYRTMAAVLVIG